MAKNILILVGGGTKHLEVFADEGKKLGLNVLCSSFSKLKYETDSGEVAVKVDDRDILEFEAVYFRVVGRRYEDAALVRTYCRNHNIRIVDRVYETDGLIRIPIPKSIEVKLLVDKGVPVPKTYFGRTSMMLADCPNLYGFPFVIKGTTGKQGNAVWAPKNIEELKELVDKFTPLEREGAARFIAQEFIKASTRKRIFIIGEKAVSGIVRPTRWRKRFLPKGTKEYLGIRESIINVDDEDAELALKASFAVGVDIGGVDIIKEDSTGKNYVLEVNSAPRWASLKKDTGVNMEKEILKYLASLK